jgi:hypothetical protein
MGKDNTKRSHYIPQFYQEYFLSPGEKTFWVYDKEGGEPRPQQPKDTAVIGHLYRFQAGLEGDFSKQEGMVKPILDRWHTPGVVPEPQEIPIVASFLAYLHTRGPRAIKAAPFIFRKIDLEEKLAWIRDSDALQAAWCQATNYKAADLLASEAYQGRREEIFQQVMRNIWEKQVKERGLEEMLPFVKFKEVREDALREQMKREEVRYAQKVDEQGLLSEILPLETFRNELKDLPQELKALLEHPPDAVALKGILLRTETIIPHLLERNWCLCAAPDRTFFVTSDTPLSVFDPKKERPFLFGGFKERTAEVAFPLSPRVCLVLSHTRMQKVCRASEQLVRKINRMTVAMAERFVLSPLKTKSLQRLIAGVPSWGKQSINTAGKREQQFSEASTAASMKERLIRAFLANPVKIDTCKT